MTPGAETSGRWNERLCLAALVLLALALLFGWNEFWFLTDDAHITFRYIDMHRRGWGYTWNPPPFLPVEGYSNFLWMILLHAVWNATGVEPPDAANLVSLLLSFGSLGLAFAIVLRLSLPPAWEPWRSWFAVAVLASAISNRTFLTWTSSGLETALFVFCITLWVFGLLEYGRSTASRWLWLGVLGAALTALTRPDGLLVVLSTGALIGLEAARRPRRWSRLFAATPLLLVGVHLLWRHSYYGAWVPNTYPAKFTRPWPEAGWRYLCSYGLEYAVWGWLLIGLCAGVKVLRSLGPSALLRTAVATPNTPALVIAATFVAHVTYYTMMIGGDHFEYRPFAHLILPMGVALIRFLAVLELRPATALAAVALAAAVALPLPWVHYSRTRNLITRASTYMMFVPVADAFPAPLRWYADLFDELQRWMMKRHVGTRHQEHKIFYEESVRAIVSREVGSRVTAEDKAVLATGMVGVPGWNMPEVAIIDTKGLNDWVVARNPVTESPGVRLMAHERDPPPGYVECFEPNVGFENGQVRLIDRATPLTDQRIRDCETKYRATMSILK